MSEEIYSFSCVQYVAGGDLKSVRSALIDSLMMNLIPFWIGDYSKQASRIDLDNFIQLHSPRWSKVGHIELNMVDHAQILVSFYLPAFPNNKEIEIHEQDIRDVLPPPAVIIRIMDAEGERQKALAFLGRYLHEFRIHRLQEILSKLVDSLGLIPVYGLTTERQLVSDVTPTPLNPQKQRGKVRDIPLEDQTLREDQQELLRMWQSGYKAKEIALRTAKTEKTILNQITILRKLHGEKLVPRRK
jgi:DNA-binding NarL/FixJ family response regulator